MTKRIVQWVSPDGRSVMASQDAPGPGWTLHNEPRWQDAFKPMESGSRYPAAIHFDLTGAKRNRVLDAADAMGLSVTHQPAGAFYVWVPTPAHAYQLGRRCKWAGLHPKDDV